MEGRPSFIPLVRGTPPREERRLKTHDEVRAEEITNDCTIGSEEYYLKHGSNVVHDRLHVKMCGRCYGLVPAAVFDNHIEWHIRHHA